MTVPCPRCDGDGYVDVFDDEGHVIGARNCDACGGPDLMARLLASLDPENDR